MKKSVIFILLLSSFIAFAEKNEKAKKENKPVMQYDARYEAIHLSKKAIMFFDTAEGILNIALNSKTGLDTWRTYDINKIAKKKGMVEREASPLFQERKVHGRYQLSLIGEEGRKLIMIDTLIGRVWTCRQSNGVCEVWKVYDLRNE